MLPTSLGVTCFRRRFEGVDDEEQLALRNAQLVAGLAGTGLGLISSTRLRGRYALRLCVLNHTTGAADVERVIEWLETADVTPGAPAAAGGAPARGPPPPPAPPPPPRRAGGAGPGPAPGALRPPGA